VMKLLSKRAEDRYQSAYGIRVDLERCLAQLERDGEIARFPLATEDYSEEFRLSQKLYGRDESIAQLLATFDRVCAGTCEVVLVPGYSGIGKSSLVNEIQRPIVGRRGFFAAGKCDQFNRNSPFSALLQALRQLVRQVLAEPEDGVARWRARLLEVVGHSGELLNDVIPELRHLIGPQPPAQQLPASEAQNRLLLLLERGDLLTVQLARDPRPETLQAAQAAYERACEGLAAQVEAHDPDLAECRLSLARAL
ncbi:MAG: AAA family ATPase, partial [Myxococcales bacterium]|nr:AAA family ATPase [Myxococcales bacterium]